MKTVRVAVKDPSARNVRRSDVPEYFLIKIDKAGIMEKLIKACQKMGNSAPMPLCLPSDITSFDDVLEWFEQDQEPMRNKTTQTDAFLLVDEKKATKPTPSPSARPPDDRPPPSLTKNDDRGGGKPQGYADVNRQAEAAREEPVAEEETDSEEEDEEPAKEEAKEELVVEEQKTPVAAAKAPVEKKDAETMLGEAEIMPDGQLTILIDDDAHQKEVGAVKKDDAALPMAKSDAPFSTADAMDVSFTTYGEEASVGSLSVTNSLCSSTVSLNFVDEPFKHREEEIERKPREKTQDVVNSTPPRSVSNDSRVIPLHTTTAAPQQPPVITTAAPQQPPVITTAAPQQPPVITENAVIAAMKLLVKQQSTPKVTLPESIAIALKDTPRSTRAAPVTPLKHSQAMPPPVVVSAALMMGSPDARNMRLSTATVNKDRSHGGLPSAPSDGTALLASPAKELGCSDDHPVGGKRRAESPRPGNDEKRARDESDQKSTLGGSIDSPITLDDDDVDESVFKDRMNDLMKDANNQFPEFVFVMEDLIKEEENETEESSSVDPNTPPHEITPPAGSSSSSQEHSPIASPSRSSSSRSSSPPAFDTSTIKALPVVQQPKKPKQSVDDTPWDDTSVDQVVTTNANNEAIDAVLEHLALDLDAKERRKARKRKAAAAAGQPSPPSDAAGSSPDSTAPSSPSSSKKPSSPAKGAAIPKVGKGVTKKKGKGKKPPKENKEETEEEKAAKQLTMPCRLCENNKFSEHKSARQKVRYHVLTHCPMKAFKCDFCHYVHFERGKVKRHHKNVHDVRDPITAYDNPLIKGAYDVFMKRCFPHYDTGKLKIGRKINYPNHVEQLHQCILCDGKVYESLDGYHILEKHMDVGVYNCDQCAFKTVVKRQLVFHKQACHNTDCSPANLFATSLPYKDDFDQAVIFIKSVFPSQINHNSDRTEAVFKRMALVMQPAFNKDVEMRDLLAAQDGLLDALNQNYMDQVHCQVCQASGTLSTFDNLYDMVLHAKTHVESEDELQWQCPEKDCMFLNRYKLEVDYHMQEQHPYNEAPAINRWHVLYKRYEAIFVKCFPGHAKYWPSSRLRPDPRALPPALLSPLKAEDAFLPIKLE